MSRLSYVDDVGQVEGERTVRLVLTAPHGRSAWDEASYARAVRTGAGVGERSLGLAGRTAPHSLRKLHTTVLGDAGVPLKERR